MPLFPYRHLLVCLALGGMTVPGAAQAPNRTDGRPSMLLYPEKLKLLLTWRQEGSEIQPVLDPSLPPLPGKSGTLATTRYPGKILEVGPDGKFLDGAGKTGLFRLDRNGVLVPSADAATFEVRYFVGARRYVTELPAVLRDAPSHLEIAFSGTARATPEEGTVLNLDGAMVGFLRPVDRPGEMGLITLAMRDLDGQGRPVWRATPIHLRSGPMDELVSSGPFTVELDHARGRWALFRNDEPLMRDLRLFTQGARPTAAITAGQEDDLAIMQSFSVLPLGPVKRTEPIPVDGKFVLPDGTTFPAAN
jgi:hypothetical protein